ncbi:MAG: cytidylate kinase-like family protein [Verrucomicrobiota bacterium]
MKIAPFDPCRAYIAAQGRSGIPQRKKLRPVITISREAGAGGVTIAGLIAKLLNQEVEREEAPPWTVFDRNLVERVIEDHDLPKTLQRFMPEDVKPDIKDAVEELLGLHPSSWTLVQHTTQTILNLARLGNVILVGRGANIITARFPHAVHVRLVAPKEARVREMESLHGMDHGAALEFVGKTDRARRRYVQRYFDTAIDDPLNYSLILNTGRIDFQTAAHLVVEAVRERTLVAWALT